MNDKTDVTSANTATSQLGWTARLLVFAEAHAIAIAAAAMVVISAVQLLAIPA